jgi:hypothetical protein
MTERVQIVQNDQTVQIGYEVTQRLCEKNFERIEQLERLERERSD